jgi:hypothetical protein
MEKLFEDKERTSLEYAPHKKYSTFDFYDNSAIEEFVIVRDKLNCWFSNYPANARKQLKRDLQSNFDSAFFELFIHEFFIRLGFTLIVHPTVSSSTNNPDFLAKKGDVEIYLEARLATDESNEDRLLKSKRGLIYDTINQIVCPNYWISIKEISFLSNNQAKLKKIKKFLQDKINQYELLGDVTANSNYHRMEENYISYTDEDIKVVISLFPCSIERSRPIGSYLGGSYMGGCEESIRGAIKDKGYKYGNLDKPYIICVNSLSYKGTRTEDVYDALFGRDRMKSFVNLDDANQDLKTSNDGIFSELSNRSYSSVSGVFITRAFPFNLHIADHWLVKHPFTDNNLDFNILDLSFIQVVEKNLKEISKLRISDIMSK